MIFYEDWKFVNFVYIHCLIAYLTMTSIQKVEEASNHAAEQVFGTSHTSGRARGRAAAQMTKDHVADNEQAYSEGKNDFLTDFHS